MTTLAIEPGQSFIIAVERLSADVTDVRIKTFPSLCGDERALLFAHYRLSSDAAGLPLHILGDGSLILPS